MKVLVTGGNRGLGKEFLESFGADSRSRSVGYDITNDANKIAQDSLAYDVFINNAFDGPPQEEWANFAQTILYMAVYDAWKAVSKTGYIFNIGSIGEKTVVAPEPRFETYRVSKAALSHASRQGTQAFKNNLVTVRTTLITPDRLDTDVSRGRPNWTGNGIQFSDISDFVKYAVNTNPNTCIEEITIYCNFTYE